MNKHITKLLSLFALCFSIVGTVKAQVQITSNDTTICPGNTVALNATVVGRTPTNPTIAGSLDDKYTGNVPIGFSFTFYGNTYTNCHLSTNGYIRFGTGISQGDFSEWDITDAVPATDLDAVYNSIMGYYADIEPTSVSMMDYATVGTAPNREFVVTFCQVPMFECSTNLATFQMVLHETTNNIDVHIGNAPSCDSWPFEAPGVAIEGVQNIDGTVGATVPGRNYPTVWTASQSSHQFVYDPVAGNYTITPIPYNPVPNGSATVSWYQNGTTLVGTGTSISVTPTATAFYVAQVTDCGATSGDTVNITVGGLAPLPTVTTPVVLCQGTTAAPLTATGSNLAWYTSLPVSGSGSAIAPVPSTTTIDTTYYYVTQTVSGCTSPAASIEVAVIGTTPPAVTTPVFYCQNAVATPLTATGTSLEWYNTVGGAGSTTAPVPNTSVANTTTYYVTQTLNGCESQPASIDVDVDGGTAPAVVTPVFYCQNAPAVALQATGNNLLWYSAANGGIGSTTIPVPSTATAGTNNYYVSQQDAAGCEGPRSVISVTTYATPALPTVVSPVVYCQYSATVPVSATGSSLLWYTAATGGIGSTTVPTPSSDSAGNTTYYVSQTINGCEGPRAAIAVTINAKPAVPTVTTNVEYCQELPAVPLVANGQNLSWYTTATGGSAGTGTPTPSTAAAGSTDYYVSQTINGCESDRAQIAVIVHPAVMAGISFSKSPACSTDSIGISFSGNAPANATFAWNFGGANVISGSGQGPYNVQFPQQDTFTVSLTVTSQYGCTDATTANIVVNTPPIADFILTPSVCVDQLIDIQPADDALYGTNYDWNFEDGDVLFGNNSGVYMVQWHTPGVKTVSLTMSSGVCQSNALVKTIVVHGRPVAQILPLDNTNTCLGDTLTFEAGSIDSGNLYAWEPASSFADSTGIIRRGIIKSASAYMTLNVTDIYGCKASDSVLITAQQCCQVILPSAFTPNGDGTNDVFRMRTDGHHVLQTFRVMNRWGQIIFNTQDEHTGWDGTFNGVPQDLGTYTYYIKYQCDGKSITQQGDILLVR